MFRGFANTSFYAADLAAAKEWYATVFGVEPYFEVPGYLEFRVGDDFDEVGIIDAAYAPPGAAGSPAGAIVHWHVDNLADEFARLLSLGATEYQPIIERGSDLNTASVVDPFGNILGIMNNPHYVEVQAGRK